MAPKKSYEAGGVSREERRHHIDLVQATISRMSAASVTTKSWLLPVVTAAYGYALVHASARVALLGILGALLFWSLDTRYLREERAYRRLFRSIVHEGAKKYEMNAAQYYRAPNGDDPDNRDPACSYRACAMSWSTGGFYLPLILGGMALLVFGLRS